MTSTFVPQFSIIQSITLGQTTVVTFTAPSDFIVGEIVSFRVSPPSGTSELNNQQATVIAATSNSIIVPIDSTNYTPFVFEPANTLVFPAMVVPAGSGINPALFPIHTILEDAFDNLPPP